MFPIFFCRLKQGARNNPETSELPHPTSLGDDPDDIEGLFASFEQDLQDIMPESRGFNVLFYLPNLFRRPATVP